MDGKSVAKTPNAKPKVYKNVKVWAAQGKYYPASDARIKDFKYEQGSKYLFSRSYSKLPICI